MKGIILLISLIGLLVLGIIAIFAEVGFNSDCGDYLKLAGDAPSIKKADEFLASALGYIEREKLTSGNTGVIFRGYPTNDCAVWYEQIQGAKATTDSILTKIAEDPESVTQLEKDNALMKIREVVLDQGNDGTSVTHPEWISLHPYATAYWIFFWIFILFGAGALIAMEME